MAGTPHPTPNTPPCPHPPLPLTTMSLFFLSLLTSISNRSSPFMMFCRAAGQRDGTVGATAKLPPQQPATPQLPVCSETGCSALPSQPPLPTTRPHHQHHPHHITLPLPHPPTHPAYHARPKPTSRPPTRGIMSPCPQPNPVHPPGESCAASPRSPRCSPAAAASGVGSGAPVAWVRGRRGSSGGQPGKGGGCERGRGTISGGGGVLTPSRGCHLDSPAGGSSPLNPKPLPRPSRRLPPRHRAPPAHASAALTSPVHPSPTHASPPPPTTGPLPAHSPPPTPATHHPPEHVVGVVVRGWRGGHQPPQQRLAGAAPLGQPVVVERHSDCVAGCGGAGGRGQGAVGTGAWRAGEGISQPRPASSATAASQGGTGCTTSQAPVQWL